ncbi:SGNH/GDSL hydrolase family protein [Chitinophaga japonensis]|uniref:Lysophospholipase L1-like esterase n=1 Tax=Chitinophaga japonensis TaxID=104662 RepID=A0A562TF67_CHIJA|nr:SGNH/GDSL hydrolase family protein [Chitinophaga japonensis]TWI91914.1 lysophospholipase L1-like esterase [Chitinophaga japonensis]
MPDKHANNKPSVSGELIRQYLAGELDDKAMHALERQALDDPFLAEALEGFSGHAPDQSAHLADLQQRLEQRVGRSGRARVRLLYYRWAAAAAILLILGLSFWWINQQQVSRRQDMARVETRETTPAPSAAKPADSAAGTPVPAVPPAGRTAEKPKAETVKAVTAAPADVPPPHPAPALHEAAKDAAPEAEALLENKIAGTETHREDAPGIAAADTYKRSAPAEVAASSAAPRPQAMVAPPARKMRQAAFVAAPRRIVVLGSSTAAGIGPQTPDSAWVNLLREYLQDKDPRAMVVNLAVGSANSYRILPHDADVSPRRPRPDLQHNITKALLLQPDAIIINMPSNDIMEGYSLQEFQRNLAAVVHRAQLFNVACYITTTQPRNMNDAEREKLQEMRDYIIRTYPNAYIDFWEGFSTPDGRLLPQYDSGDGVHLNGRGHRLMLERVKERIE